MKRFVALLMACLMLTAAAFAEDYTVAEKLSHHHRQHAPRMGQRPRHGCGNGELVGNQGSGKLGMRAGEGAGLQFIGGDGAEVKADR